MTRAYRFFAVILITFLCAVPVSAQEEEAQGGDASQMAFSDLQNRANRLVSRGNLREAIPLLRELINRIDVAEAEDVSLDFSIYLLATAHVQRFANTGETKQLSEALRWFDRLEEEYPRSSNLKDALMKKAEVLRVLGRYDDAINLMGKMIGGEYFFSLRYTEEVKLLKNITETYNIVDRPQEGLPYFRRLRRISRDPAEEALAAAASFHAHLENKDLDAAMELLPYLARETEIRYRPKLNVALLKMSDLLVAEERYNDATLLLNLTKTTEDMVEYHEDLKKEKESELERKVAFGQAEDEVAKLEKEIETIENNLEKLKELPTLRDELLVRRARNYTKTDRLFEAYWMFFDLMREYPDDERVEFYYYSTFSNAREIGKIDSVQEIGREYREKFPDGDYYSDVTAAFAQRLREAEKGEEFLRVMTDYLSAHPEGGAAPNIMAQWAEYNMSRENYAEIIDQVTRWKNMHDTPLFEDGLFYWKGLAHLQIAEYPGAVAEFDSLLDEYPNSTYAEDALVRKGAGHFYAQEFEKARAALQKYTEKYPEGSSLDQANFFLGEVESYSGNHEQALDYFQRADEVTNDQSIHDSAAFRIGSVYATLERHQDIVDHFKEYVERFGENGQLARAMLEMGKAYKKLRRPTKMLAIYSEAIKKHADTEGDAGVDQLVEAYGEEYHETKATYSRTVRFLDRLEEDREFREKIVTDRGFLFEHFYNNDDLHQPLYNRLRRHPEFGENLMEGLSPIEDLTSVYREEMANFPEETPEEFFRELLSRFRAEDNRLGEARMLMGLYRVDVEMEPSFEYDSEFLRRATPRLLLYVADYSKSDRIEFAMEAWDEVLRRYPEQDAAIVALMRLADVEEKRGNKEEALAHLQKIVERFPGSPKIPAVILRQGEILTELGRTADAREKYQRILRTPDWRGAAQAQALYQIGQSYMADEAYPEAHGFFERTFIGYANFSEWGAKAYLADAEALVQMGETGDAISTLEEAVEEMAETAPDEIMEKIRRRLRELRS